MSGEPKSCESKLTVRKTIVGISSLIFICSCAASDPAEPELPVPQAVTLSTNAATLTSIGESVQLSATVKDQKGTVIAAALHWESANSTVASVDASGLVMAAGNGTTEISATAGSAVGRVTVTVQQAVASITLSPGEHAFTSLGETKSLVAQPKDALGMPVTGAAVAWSSSNPAVVTVSNAGLVTAIANGTASITVNSGVSASASAAVSVTQVATSVAISLGLRALYRGASATVSATASDARGNAISGRQVTIQSSNPGVLRISPNGALLEAIADGSSTISAKLDTATAQRTVSVLPVGGVSGFTIDTLTLRFKSVTLSLNAILTNGDAVPVSLSAVTTSDSTIVAKTASGIRAMKDGVADIVVTVAGYVQTRRVKVVSFEDRAVPALLSAPAPGALHRIPVIDVRVLPTRDGVRLDSLAAPDFYELGSRSLAQMQQHIEDVLIKTKYALEEGSRFRGYADPTAPPSISLEVIRTVTLYAVAPKGPLVGHWGGLPKYLVDFSTLFAELGVLSDINRHGVKQVWVSNISWSGEFPSIRNRPPGFDTTSARATAESAMSNPNGLCVSNSFALDCEVLPKANHTYVMVGGASFRGWSCTVHNHGHQFERIFSFFDRDNLFWPRFATYERAGNTHSPPNTVAGYDYRNATLVPADIKAWQPAGGPKSPVNVQTWESVKYRYSDEDNCGGTWLTYWMQNFPGRNNPMVLNGRALENWWDIYADFDLWLSQNRTLVKNATASAQANARATSLNLPVYRAETDYPRPPRQRW